MSAFDTAFLLRKEIFLSCRYNLTIYHLQVSHYATSPFQLCVQHGEQKKNWQPSWLKEITELNYWTIIFSTQCQDITAIYVTYNTFLKEAFHLHVSIWYSFLTSKRKYFCHADTISQSTICKSHVMLLHPSNSVSSMGNKRRIDNQADWKKLQNWIIELYFTAHHARI